jgi:hypothetical protein
MDAGGLIHWAHEVFRALRDEPLRGAPSTLTDTEIVTALGGKRDRPALPLGYPSATGRKLLQGPGVVWRRTTIDGPVPGLVAKAAVSIARHAGARGIERIRTMVPVDLRNYKRDLLTTANASYPIFIDVEPTHDWTKVYKTILKKLADKEAIAIGWDETFVGFAPIRALPLAVRVFMGTQWLRDRFQFTASIAHLPKLGDAALSGGGFKFRTAHFLPAPSQILPLAVAAISHAGKTEVTVAAPRALAGELEVVALSTSIAAALRAPAKTQELPHEGANG